jgi:hypothetical protein
MFTKNMIRSRCRFASVSVFGATSLTMRVERRRTSGPPWAQRVEFDAAVIVKDNRFEHSVSRSTASAQSVEASFHFPVDELSATLQ